MSLTQLKALGYVTEDRVGQDKIQVETGCSEKTFKFFHGQTRLTDNRTQCPFRHLTMIGHGQSSVRMDLLPQYHVASPLTVELIADFSKRHKDFAARDDRKRAHKETSTTSSNMEGGTGSP